MKTRCDLSYLRIGAKTGEQSTQRRELKGGVADAAELAWISQAVLEAAKDARDIADLGHGLEQLA